jgi:prepilin-type N-terminal cleavage/methylation domain-containing protein
MRQTKAFSLTELVVVLVIIAIGAAFAMPSLGKGIENQKMKAVQSSVRYLRDRVILYAKEYNDGTTTYLDGTLPSTGYNNNDLSQLFNTRYLVPDDLAFYANPGQTPGANVTWTVANYFVKPLAPLDAEGHPNINLAPGTAASTPLFKVCGTFDAASSRFFCIYQCLSGGQESESTVVDSTGTCPVS